MRDIGIDDHCRFIEIWLSLLAISGLSRIKGKGVLYRFDRTCCTSNLAIELHQAQFLLFFEQCILTCPDTPTFKLAIELHQDIGAVLGLLLNNVARPNTPCPIGQGALGVLKLG